MLIVLLVIALGLFVFSFIVNNDNDTFGFIGMLVSGVIGIIVIAALIAGVSTLSQGRVIDQKIEMYIEENAKIETNVTTTVEKYLEHEFNIFDSLQGEDIQTLLVVYPEINSNELVKKQVEIFVENNNKIKQLKEEKLNIQIWKWWVYFG